MDKGASLEFTEPTESSVLLGILPMFLRRKLVDERSFRQKIGFEAEELVTYGEDIVFSRSQFFERASEALSVDGGQSEIEDHAGKRWILSLEQISNGRVALKIANDSESFFAPEFFVFLPDASERLRELDVVLKDHGFPLSGLSEWRDLLMDRALTIDELEEFSEDIMKTPSAFLKVFRRKIEGTNVSAEDMVLKNIEYFENLSGKGGQKTLPDLVSDVISRVVADYLAWDDEAGPRMALLLCSHPSISNVIASSGIKEQRLIELAEWVRDHGDVFSKVGIVEAALPVAHNSPGLERTLDDIVQQIIALDPEDKSGPLQLMMSLIVLVESEVSRTRVLKHWPPFRRRLATFAHAAMLARETKNRIDVEHLSAWIMENQGHRFYLQNLLDLRAEPRWLPDYLSPSQLKQELLGRLSIAVGSLSEGLPEGPLRDTLNPQNLESAFNRIRTMKSSFPGPLEGSDSSLRNPIPKELEDALDGNLSGDALTAKSVTVLINATSLFRVGSEKAEKAVELIRASYFRFAENIGDAEKFSFLHGLAEVASRLRSEGLARSVRAVARSHRDEPSDERRYSEEVIICLVAAGAFEEFDAWKAFLGSWIKELCFNVSKGGASELESSIEMICSIEPRLRSELGAGLAALASIR
jgi:hypothetical protein